MAFTFLLKTTRDVLGAFVTSGCVKVVYIFDLPFLTEHPAQHPESPTRSHYPQHSSMITRFLILYFIHLWFTPADGGNTMTAPRTRHHGLEAPARSAGAEAAPAEESGAYSLKTTRSIKCA